MGRAEGLPLKHLLNINTSCSLHFVWPAICKSTYYYFVLHKIIVTLLEMIPIKRKKIALRGYLIQCGQYCGVIAIYVYSAHMRHMVPK